MIKEKYEEKTVTRIEKVLVEKIKYCDCCGKEIDGDYFECMTGHHDWQEDSADSIKYHDCCSKECLLEKVNEYYSIGDGKSSNTAYFEIEKNFWKSKKANN